MERTAAGEVSVIASAKCPVRGNTTMFLGKLADGRFVVASRFQIELRTSKQIVAERRFKELCNA